MDSPKLQVSNEFKEASIDDSILRETLRSKEDPKNAPVEMINVVVDIISSQKIEKITFESMKLVLDASKDPSNLVTIMDAITKSLSSHNKSNYGRIQKCLRIMGHLMKKSLLKKDFVAYIRNNLWYTLETLIQLAEFDDDLSDVASEVRQDASVCMGILRNALLDVSDNVGTMDQQATNQQKSHNCINTNMSSSSIPEPKKKSKSVKDFLKFTFMKLKSKSKDDAAMIDQMLDQHQPSPSEMYLNSPNFGRSQNEVRDQFNLDESQLQEDDTMFSVVNGADDASHVSSDGSINKPIPVADKLIYPELFGAVGSVSAVDRRSSSKLGSIINMITNEKGCSNNPAVSAMKDAENNKSVLSRNTSFSSTTNARKGSTSNPVAPGNRSSRQSISRPANASISRKSSRASGISVEAISRGLSNINPNDLNALEQQGNKAETDTTNIASSATSCSEIAHNNVVEGPKQLNDALSNRSVNSSDSSCGSRSSVNSSSRGSGILTANPSTRSKPVFLKEFNQAMEQSGSSNSGQSSMIVLNSNSVFSAKGELPPMPMEALKKFEKQPKRS